MRQFIAAIFLMAGGLFGERVYIASQKEGVFVAELDVEKGTLSGLRKAGEGRGTSFIAKHPTQPLLFSVERVKGENSGSYVVSYHLKEDGSIEKRAEANTEGDGVCHVSVDETGKVVLAANYSSGSVASFLVEEDGVLSDAISTGQHEGSSVHERRQKGPHAHWIGVGPGNKFAYVPDLGIDEVVIYELEAQSGKIKKTGAGKLAPGAGPRHMKFSKDGQFSYVLNELDLTITVFSVDAGTGALSEVQTLSTVPEDFDKKSVTCSEIRVHPNGRFVYCAMRDLDAKPGDGVARNSLSAFAVKESGTLERIQTVSAGVQIPRNFNLNSSGQWLFVGGQRSNDIKIFGVAQDGMLSLTGESYELAAPMCFQF